MEMSAKTQTYTFVQDVHAPAPRVYQAFTNSSLLRQWLCDVAVINAKPGGYIYLVWNSGFYTAGEFVELNPNQRVVFTWFGRSEPGRTNVEVEIIDKGETTQVLLKHSGVGAEEEWKTVITEIQNGWTSSLVNLASVLETGEDMRFTRRPMLGIGLNAFNEEIALHIGVPVSQGLRIDSTLEGMGAHAAGLQSNDVIVTLDGYQTVSFADLATVLQKHRSGDQMEVQFYRGPEKRSVMMTLSGRPLPNIPATIAELAEKVRSRYADINRDMDDFLDDVSEEEASHRPAPDEWSIKEVLAHLIYDERNTQNYIGEVAGEWESHYSETTGNQQFRIDATLAVHPTLLDLRQELKRAFQETVEHYTHLPENLPAHKSSYWRIAYAGLDSPFHYQGHLEQMQAALLAARSRAIS
jgi:uncharacterized protein YndB with AHSA1/START domain